MQYNTLGISREYLANGTASVAHRRQFPEWPKRITGCWRNQRKLRNDHPIVNSSLKLAEVEQLPRVQRLFQQSFASSSKKLRGWSYFEYIFLLGMNSDFNII